MAVSFVKTAEDIEMVRKTMRSMTDSEWLPPIVAKLERPEAVQNLESIIKVTDGVMVARGDLESKCHRRLFRRCKNRSSGLLI